MSKEEKLKDLRRKLARRQKDFVTAENSVRRIQLQIEQLESDLAVSERKENPEKPQKKEEESNEPTKEKSDEGFSFL
jgi:predicted  nucleic acid-binding Zn-ribbon protein